MTKDEQIEKLREALENARRAIVVGHGTKAVAAIDAALALTTSEPEKPTGVVSVSEQAMLTATYTGVIEEADNLRLERVATVRTKRGEEFLINLDKAAVALSELFSDMDNERRFGWELEARWFHQEVAKLRKQATDTSGENIREPVLEAEVAKLTRERDAKNNAVQDQVHELNDYAVTLERKLKTAEAEVAKLTRERDEARRAFRGSSYPGRHEWCQPGDALERRWIVMFEDRDRGTAIFSDEAEARIFWGNANTNWNCWLFAAAPRDPKAAEARILAAKREAYEECAKIAEQKDYGSPKTIAAAIRKRAASLTENGHVEG
jgi:hypothetical protein